MQGILQVSLCTARMVRLIRHSLTHSCYVEDKEYFKPAPASLATRTCTSLPERTPRTISFPFQGEMGERQLHN